MQLSRFVVPGAGGRIQPERIFSHPLYRSFNGAGFGNVIRSDPAWA